MKTLELDTHEFNSMQWAIHDAMGKWSKLIQECKSGKHPNMSLEGAESIYRDFSTIKSKLQVLSSFD